MRARFAIRLTAATLATGALWTAPARGQIIATDPGTTYHATALTGFATPSASTFQR